MGDDSSFSDTSDFETHTKPCNWCGGFFPFVPGKQFCKKCGDAAFKECRRCHRPYPDESFFELDKERCTSCHKKYLIERTKREMKRQANNGAKRKLNFDASGPNKKKTGGNGEESITITRTPHTTTIENKAEAKKNGVNGVMPKRGFIPIYFSNDESCDV